jgi:hypothetical protein
MIKILYLLLFIIYNITCSLSWRVFIFRWAMLGPSWPSCFIETGKSVVCSLMIVFILLYLFFYFISLYDQYFVKKYVMDRTLCGINIYIIWIPTSELFFREEKKLVYEKNVNCPIHFHHSEIMRLIFSIPSFIYHIWYIVDCRILLWLQWIWADKLLTRLAMPNIFTLNVGKFGVLYYCILISFKVWINPLKKVILTSTWKLWLIFGFI